MMTISTLSTRTCQPTFVSGSGSLRTAVRGSCRVNQLATATAPFPAVTWRSSATCPTPAFARVTSSFRMARLQQLSCQISRCLSSESNRSSGGRFPKPGKNRLTTGIGVLGTSAIVLAGKGKYLLGALKLTKFASLGSMLVTVGTYSMFFGLPYAAGMVGLILVHESGHALVMKRLGIPFSPMVFVPFMGAVIAMKNQPRDAYQEALVAFGGPYLGTVGAVAVSVGAHMTDSQLLFALADFGFMINLFNMLPIGTLDGGRICGALSPYAGLAGLGMGGFMIYSDVIHNPIFYLVMLGGAWTTFQRLYYPADAPINYYKISPGQKAAVSAGYFGLITFLFAAMAMNHRRQKPPEILERERRNKELTFVDF